MTAAERAERRRLMRVAHLWPIVIGVLTALGIFWGHP